MRLCYQAAAKVRSDQGNRSVEGRKSPLDAGPSPLLGGTVPVPSDPGRPDVWLFREPAAGAESRGKGDGGQEQRGRGVKCRVRDG